MELRAREARARGKTPRHVQRWVQLPPHLAQPHARGARRRRRCVLAARRRRRRAAAGIDRSRLGARQLRARRQHHHAAAGEEPVSVAVEESAAEAQRADHRAAARGRAEEVADSRAVPERDRMGRRHLRRRSGRAHVLSAAAPPASDRRSRRCSPAPSSIRGCSIRRIRRRGWSAVSSSSCGAWARSRRRRPMPVCRPPIVAQPLPADQPSIDQTAPEVPAAPADHCVYESTTDAPRQDPAEVQCRNRRKLREFPSQNCTAQR